MDFSAKTLLVAGVLAAVLFAAAVGLLVRLVRTRKDLRRAGLPTGPRWVFWGAVAYLVLPFDLLPDPVYLDDIGVLFFALRTLQSAAGDAGLRPARRPGRSGLRRLSGADDDAP
ncbi:YkvA family protein [Streptomyces sp. NPDC046985]|uniref:YkvA family protein n=1 Tax=Streptomyces sp. NPDC046985 TaxID=3155377 RepID=UPI0033ED9EC9